MKKYATFITLITILNGIVPYGMLKAQSWSSTPYYYSQMVYTLANNNGSLVAGGVFSVPNEIRAMSVYNGDLYSGGTSMGASTPVYQNGSSIGSTHGGYHLIFAMTVFNGNLYVAGSFDSIGNTPANNIARWNGSTWSAVGSGVGMNSSDIVYSLCVYNNDLYAAGNFGSIERWNGSSWSSIGTSPGSLVRGMGTWNGSLYIGGFFTAVSGVGAVNIAAWNGFNWNNAGDVGIASDPAEGLSVLLSYNGFLYAGGHFSEAGGVSANNIARYDGTWYALGNGTDGTVTALLEYNQSLMVAGAFNQAGGITVGRIARWTTCAAASITASGPTTVCQGNGVTLSSTVTSSSYQWQLNNTFIPGATSSSYTATASGNYRCIMGACGQPTSNTIAVAVNPLPAASVTAGGAVTFCSGGSVLLQAPVNPNRSYQWKKNGINLPGAVSSAYTATSSGTYKVIVTNTNTGCSKTTGTGTVVTVYSNPTVTITPQGPTTFCLGDSVLLKANYNSTYSYQWKRNNVNISGAVTNKLTAKTAGNYKVKVTNVKGCTAISNTLTVSVPCRNATVFAGNHSAFETFVYPNPSDGILNIGASLPDEKIIRVELSNAMGKILFRKSPDAQEDQIDCTPYPDGIYFLSLWSGNGKMVTRKISVLK